MMSYLFILVPLIAFIYAGVGFGGATGYLAAMSFFGVSPQVMASTALLLNVLVASVSFSSFYRAGHFRQDLIRPLLVTSIPGAFIGSTIQISAELYTGLLHMALTFVALRLLFFNQHQEAQQPLRPAPLHWTLLTGLVIGLLSGMVGIGGGVFLSPLIILGRWGTSKQAAAASAAFIVLNSISGLLGRIASDTFMLDAFSLGLLPLAITGALAGSYYGAHILGNPSLRRALGLVMSLVVANFWLDLWK